MPTTYGNHWAWAIDVDSLLAGGAVDDTIVIEPSPGDPLPGSSGLDGRDTAVTALLRVDLSALTLEDGDSIQLLRGSSSEAIDGGLFLSLLLKKSNGQYLLQARTRDDAEAIQKTGWATLSAQHDLAIQWRASSAPGADDGALRYWADGAILGQLVGLDNDTKRIEALAFGAHRSVLSQSTGSLGELRLSDLASFPGQ
jgi:hypothetical protein